MQKIPSDENAVILLVEDDPDQAQVLRYFLRNQGFDVEWQNTPRAALRAAQDRACQLILLDIMLNAEEDGFDLCRAFKENPSLKDIPIIMVTARADVKDRISGLRAGADDYVIKPFSEDELLARVQGVLARKHSFDFNEKYRALLENSDDIVLFLNMRGEVEQSNHQAFRVFPEIAWSSGKFSLAALFEDAFAENLQQLYSRVAGGFDVSGNNWRLKAPHGDVEMVDVRLVPLSRATQISGMGCILRDATPREKLFQAMEAQTRSLTHQVEHSNARLSEMEQKLILSEKMAAMGQLAAGIAHELRNPLSIISTSIYYLRRLLEKAHPKAHEHFEILEQEIARSQRIITDLLDFSRKSSSQKLAVDVNAVLGQTIGLVKKELANYDILVRMELGAPPKAYVNADDLKQIFLNLILNAREAMPYGGKLYVRSYEKEGPLAGIEFADTGVGIPDAIKDKIFDPFFTYGKEGHGVGLGLSVVHSAIVRNRGSIRFTSQPDKGATFYITLPGCDGAG